MHVNYFINYVDIFGFPRISGLFVCSGHPFCLVQWPTQARFPFLKGLLRALVNTGLSISLANILRTFSSQPRHEWNVFNILPNRGCIVKSLPLILDPCFCSRSQLREPHHLAWARCKHGEAWGRDSRSGTQA
jgi:hypothetical protein